MSVLVIYRKISVYTFMLCLFALHSCMDDVRPIENFNTTNSVIVVCNGNFMFGNASLTSYMPESKLAEHNVFFRANALPLGDVAQSILLYNDIAWVTVNNSGKIYALDPNTYTAIEKIDSLLSPRYLHPLNENKAYLSDLYAQKIWIIDLEEYTVSGSIDIGIPSGNFNRHCSEQMVQWGEYLFTNCWNYDNQILIIDTQNDAVVDSITVGLQPQKIIADINGKIWVICDGSYEGSPVGNEDPSIWCVDAVTRNVLWYQSLPSISAFTFDLGLSIGADTLFVLANDLYGFSVLDTEFPSNPIISGAGNNFSAIGVHPISGEVYVADSKDNQQMGVVFRFNRLFQPVDTFDCGINPVDFGFVTN